MLNIDSLMGEQNKHFKILNETHWLTMILYVQLWIYILNILLKVLKIIYLSVKKFTNLKITEIIA